MNAESPPGYGQPQEGPQQGIVPLRPLDLGDVLSGAFRYIRSQPVVALVPAAIVMLIVTPLQFMVQAVALPEPGEPLPGFAESLDVPLWQVLPLSLVGVLIYPPMLALQFAVLVPAVLGRRPTPAQAWAAARPHLGRVYGVYLVFAIVGAVLSNIGLEVAVTVGRGGSGLAILFAVLIGLVAYAAWIYLAVLLFPAVPAVQIEGLGVRAALERSRALVRGAWWQMFGYQLVAGLVTVAAAMVVIVPVSVVWIVVLVTSDGFASGASGSLPSSWLVIMGVATGIVGVVTTPYMVAAAGLVYLNRRFRRERFDLELSGRM